MLSIQNYNPFQRYQQLQPAFKSKSHDSTHDVDPDADQFVLSDNIFDIEATDQDSTNPYKLRNEDKIYPDDGHESCGC